MKRALATLLDYGTSDEDDAKAVEAVRPHKKRKLPTLSSSLMVPVPIDDPAQHQGRVRTHPHVEGQYATHVYLSLRLKSQSAMCRLLRDVVAEAKTRVPSLQEACKLESEGNSSKSPELHISLSRPIYLRAYQREDFKREVMRISKQQKPFSMSFTTFSELVNDERTRVFLAVEIGAGHHELKSLATALAPIIRQLRQQGYYENPRFHASLAWALLDRSSSIPSLLGSPGSVSQRSTPGLDIPNGFPTITHFPKDLISTLNERYNSALASTKVGLFDAESITVKIGKDTFTWNMSG
ncbi:hypothetical protein F5887DRAFT_878788 [Amanita rubescens]|nr:hypothetical protein F5887DRAFT_878788 [Amanita rubescens]